MRHQIPIVLFILVVRLSYGQETWVKGSCVTIQGDTLYGKILFNDWDTSPHQVTFRDTTTQIQKAFSTDELKSFELIYDNKFEVFESKTVKITKYSLIPGAYGTNPIKFDTLSRFIELKFKSEIISLFELIDDSMSPHFYISKNSVLTELQYGNVYFTKNELLVKYTYNEYRMQLKELLKECSTLKVSNVKYDVNSLIKLLEEYHSFCKIDYDVLFKKESQTIIDIGVSARRFNLPENDEVSTYNAVVRFLLPKRFNNRFITLELGQGLHKENNITYTQMNFNFYVGTYFGKKTNTVLPFIYFGPLGMQVGTGFSIYKKFDLAIQTRIGKEGGLGFAASIYPFPLKK